MDSLIGLAIVLLQSCPLTTEKHVDVLDCIAVNLFSPEHFEPVSSKLNKDSGRHKVILQVHLNIYLGRAPLRAGHVLVTESPVLCFGYIGSLLLIVAKENGPLYVALTITKLTTGLAS